MPSDPFDPAALKPATLLVHHDRLTGELPYGALFEQRFDSVAYEFADTATMEATYQGRQPGFGYGRQGSPTAAALERKITALEGGVGTLAFSTGMAAYDAVLATLLRAGDHVIASRFLFANTVSLLNSYRRRFGVEVDFVDVTDAAAVAAAVRARTVLIMVETIANPRTQVPDLAEIGRIAARDGIAYLVDNTITSPLAFQPKAVGASLVVHSLTKILGGHGRVLGGTVTDTGALDWSRSRPVIEDAYRSLGPQAYLTQLRKLGRRDKGATLASGDAGAIALGLETLALRVRQSAENARAIAQMLAAHPAVERVHYPGLASHPQHQRAQTLFRHPGYLMSFELKPNLSVAAVLDRLRVVVRASSLGDSRTLAIAPATTIFHELGPARRAEMGIAESLVRLSVGIEDAGDLIADLEAALGAR